MPAKSPNPPRTPRPGRKRADPLRALTLPRTILRNRGDRPDLPRFLTYIVTFTCNARCIMCDSWKKPSPNDLTLDEIGALFDQMPKLDAVRLSGGEPFVRKDMPEIAELVRTKLDPVFLHVTTNGFLTDRIVKFCEERVKDRPLQLLISIDGVREKHNHVRGKDTAYDSVMKTLGALALRQEELKLHVSVNQTIVDPEGVEHYKLLREVLKPMGVRNNVVMAYDVSATYSLDDEVDAAPTQIGEFCTFGDFSEEHLRELMDEIEKDLGDYPFADRIAKRYYMRGIRNRLLHDRGTPNPKCVALNTHMRLMPDGTIPICQFNSKRVGNVREKSFEEIWFGEEIAPHREWVRKCPGCWAECEVLPSAIYTGDLLKETLMPSRN